MIKHWYYTYQADAVKGYGICMTHDGEFDVAEIFSSIVKEHNVDKKKVIITNWKEISSTQYEKMLKFISE